MEVKLVRSGQRPQAARGQNWVEDKIALRKKKIALRTLRMSKDKKQSKHMVDVRKKKYLNSPTMVEKKNAQRT